MYGLSEMYLTVTYRSQKLLASKEVHSFQKRFLLNNLHNILYSMTIFNSTYKFVDKSELEIHIENFVWYVFINIAFIVNTITTRKTTITRIEIMSIYF